MPIFRLNATIDRHLQVSAADRRTSRPPTPSAGPPVNRRAGGDLGLKRPETFLPRLGAETARVDVLSGEGVDQCIDRELAADAEEGDQAEWSSITPPADLACTRGGEYPADLGLHGGRD